MGVIEYTGQEALDVVDVIALEQRIAADGTPLLELMQRAGQALAEVAAGYMGPGGHIAIFAGSGNNGGDGWVAARLLGACKAGFEVTLVTAKAAAELKAQPAHDAACDCMEAIDDGVSAIEIVLDPTDAELQRILASSDVVIDAMLGTGFAHDEVREPMRSWIAAINERRAKGGVTIIVADCPSGLNAQTGTAAATTVRADVTVTMIVPKTGLVMPKAAPYVGKLLIAPLVEGQIS